MKSLLTKHTTKTIFLGNLRIIKMTCVELKDIKAIRESLFNKTSQINELLDNEYRCSNDEGNMKIEMTDMSIKFIFDGASNYDMTRFLVIMSKLATMLRTFAVKGHVNEEVNDDVEDSNDDCNVVSVDNNKRNISGECIVYMTHLGKKEFNEFISERVYFNKSQYRVNISAVNKWINEISNLHHQANAMKSKFTE